MNKAVFLDRDGVLIKAPISKDKKPLSIKNISDLKFLPTVIKTCKNSGCFSRKLSARRDGKDGVGIS